VKRAVIIDKDHPWYSHSGNLTDEEIKATGQLVMELDNGMKAGVYVRQLKMLEEK